MAAGDIGIPLRNPGDHRPPEPGSLEDVGLIDRDQPAPPLPGQLERPDGNPLDFRRAVAHVSPAPSAPPVAERRLGRPEIRPPGRSATPHETTAGTPPRPRARP